MRLRNIPGADEVIRNCAWVIKEPAEKKGKWNTVFGNENPVHIEVGMGKGQFITEMAKRNPQINYIGIERYTSVLLRAVQKREQLPEEEALPNLLYLCIDASELPEIFAKDEVAKIYLNFSDPWLMRVLSPKTTTENCMDYPFWNELFTFSTGFSTVFVKKKRSFQRCFPPFPHIFPQPVEESPIQAVMDAAAFWKFVG